jgi:hypothetical protein
MITVYVDDMIITGDYEGEIAQLKAKLDKEGKGPRATQILP